MMRRGQMSNAGWPIFKEHVEANFAVDTPDGVHMTSSYPDRAGPLDFGPYRVQPGAPVMREGMLTGPVTRGSRSGQGKTVTVK